MRLRGLILGLIPLLLLGASPEGGAPAETAVAREARLRRTLTAAETGPDALAAAQLELASLLTFTLERDFSEAIRLAEPLLRAAEAATPPNPDRIDELRHLLAFAYSYTGRTAEAEALLISVRDAQLVRLGPEHKTTLQTRADLSVLHARNGRPDLAEPELQAIAEIYHAQEPGGEDDLHARTQWAIALGRRGRWADAERVLREVTALRIARLGPDHPHLTQQYNLLCWVLYSTDRAAEALPLMEKLAAIRTREYGAEASTTLVARFNLASLYARMDRTAEAETLLRADLALAERTAEGYHEPAGYLRKLGEIALRRGDAATAVRDLRRGEQLYLEARTEGWRDAESRDFESLRQTLGFALLAAEDRPEAIRVTGDWLAVLEEQFRLRLLHTSEADRLALLQEEAPFDLPGTLGDPALLARTSLRLKGLVLDSIIEDQALAAAAEDPAVSALLVRYRAALESAAPPDQLEVLERELTRRTQTFHASRAALQSDPAEFLTRLPAGTAYVDYLRYQHQIDGRTRESRYCALVGTAGGWQVIPLGPAATLDAAIDRYRILATRDGPVAWAQDVRRLALDPVRAALPPDITRLILSPDAQLHGVAFATLPEDDGNALALDRHAFAQVTSARDLWPRAPGATGVRPPLALAAPAWHGNLASLAPLPEALAEGQDFAARFPDGTLLTGEAATPAALAAHGAPRLMHIATHAITVRDPALGAAEAMRRTGLALAGERGWFDALQIATLDLRATELVFLSACSTGVGPTARGEGVLGLQRGFARAGARSLVATLWPVADADSRTLAALFYDALARTGDAVDALREAQRTRHAQLVAEGVPPVTRLRRAGAHVISVRR